MVSLYFKIFFLQYINYIYHVNYLLERTLSRLLIYHWG